MIGDDAGLSLVEILVALAVIGIGLVGVAVVVPVATYGVQEGSQLSTATFLAEQRLEEVRGAPWAATPPNDCLGVSTGNTAPISTTCTRSAPIGCAPGAACTTYADEGAVAGFLAYGRTVRVTDCATGSGCMGIVHGGMRLVTVTVSYHPISGAGGTPADARKSATVDLLIARR
jgi:prepilin-type N-terminal cleavage/methylation domain-containing protein